jgi:hypothetical protein
MAEKAIGAGEKRLDFVGMDQVVALYADSFLVAHMADAFTLFFFQNQVPSVKAGVLGSTSKLESAQAKCISRIVISETGFKKLLESMAKNIADSTEQK